MAYRIAAQLKPDPTPKRNQRNWTERLFEERDGAARIMCKGCERVMYIPPSQIGQRATCCRKCSDDVKARQKPVEAWAKRIQEKRDGTVEKPCKFCLAVMHLPKSKTDRVFCCRACQSASRSLRRESLSKHCETCGTKFYNTQRSGSREARFCSQACNTAGRTALMSAEAQAKAAANRKAAIDEGRVVLPRGEEKPNWKGGQKAYRRRYTESGKAAVALRAYRKANPDKVREFSERRKGRKVGRLPRGTISSIRSAQNNKCAVCRVRLGRKYHVDHIMPLARGGAHAPNNIQLLCPPCNLTKSDKDPIAFMQSLGRLL